MLRLNSNWNKQTNKKDIVCHALNTFDDTKAMVSTDCHFWNKATHAHIRISVGFYVRQEIIEFNVSRNVTKDTIIERQTVPRNGMDLNGCYCWERTPYMECIILNLNAQAHTQCGNDYKHSRKCNGIYQEMITTYMVSEYTQP